MTERKPGHDEQFCPACGDIVNEQAPHCPGCGHPINPDERGQSGATPAGETDIGYETLDEKRERQVELVKEIGGTVAEGSGSPGTLLKRLALWIFGLIFLLAGIGALLEPSPGAGVVLLLVGLLALPPVHSLIGRDASIDTFGSRRIVEERAVTDADRPCAACARPVEEGVERTRVEQFLVFGGAVSYTVQGQSTYCSECARGEGVPTHPGGTAEDADISGGSGRTSTDAAEVTSTETGTSVPTDGSDSDPESE